MPTASAVGRSTDASAVPRGRARSRPSSGPPGRCSRAGRRGSPSRRYGSAPTRQGTPSAGRYDSHRRRDDGPVGRSAGSGRQLETVLAHRKGPCGPYHAGPQVGRHHAGVPVDADFPLAPIAVAQPHQQRNLAAPNGVTATRRRRSSAPRLAIDALRAGVFHQPRRRTWTVEASQELACAWRNRLMRHFDTR